MRLVKITAFMKWTYQNHTTEQNNTYLIAVIIQFKFSDKEKSTTTLSKSVRYLKHPHF